MLSGSTCRLSADGWSRRAVGILYEHGGKRIIAEVNNGIDLVWRFILAVYDRVPCKPKGDVDITDEELESELIKAGSRVKRTKGMPVYTAMVQALTDLLLEAELIKAGVFWDRKDGTPDLDVMENGRLRLSVCTSFSYDAGYSIYKVGYGGTLSECIADLHDSDD